MAHRFCVGSYEFLDSVGSACGVVSWRHDILSPPLVSY